jgi:hypothetical protein
MLGRPLTTRALLLLVIFETASCFLPRLARTMVLLFIYDRHTTTVPGFYWLTWGVCVCVCVWGLVNFLPVGISPTFHLSGIPGGAPLAAFIAVFKL